MNIDECLSHPCMNNGQCVDGIDDFTCQCRDGWTGDLCDEDIDECKNHSCKHDSKCINKVAHYMCECRNGFTGKYCETNIDDCLNKPCQHGGLYNHLKVCPQILENGFFKSFFLIF